MQYKYDQPTKEWSLSFWKQQVKNQFIDYRWKQIESGQTFVYCKELLIIILGAVKMLYFTWA